MAISGSNALFWPFGDVVNALTGGGEEEAQATVPQSSTETAAETISKSQATAQAATTAKKRAVSRSRSVYSSPLGLAGEATTIKKTLLGQ